MGVQVQVYTLGGFRVLVDGRPIEEQAWRRKTARQLFKVLLARPGRRIPREEAIELFWPESDLAAGSTNLRSAVHALRHALEAAGASPDLVSNDHTSVWLPPQQALWADSDEFEQAVARAWRSKNPLPLLEEAIQLYAGDFLPDDPYDDWASDRRETLRRTWTELQFGLARALDASNDVSAAMEPLERLLRADPCNEHAAQELMRLLARRQRRGEALRVYQRLIEALRHELDVDPSPESVEVHRQINAGQSVAPPPSLSTSFRCAYPFPQPQALVGRSEELAVLAKLLATGRSAGAVAFISAPAGTGKSALVGEAVVQAQTEGILCLAGGCYEERGAMPLGPFHDALLDLLLAQPPEYMRNQLGSALEDIVQVMPELRYHLRLTAESPSGAAAPLDRTRAFGAIHTCLRGLADRGPVLLCLEDLHAADEATLQLVHYLARQMRRLPLVIIATYRSDEAPPGQPLAQTVAAMAREGVARRIALSPLDRDDTTRLVAALLEGSPSDALSESVYATTGGNALFVEQFVLALEESGKLQRRDGVWEGATDLEATPPIVREIIAQRLHRLDSSCRETLAVAAVLGNSFEHRVLLAAVAPTDETVLLRDLDRAIAGQLLQDTSGGYAFRHTLVRDAVYWDLSAPRRMLLHKRTADVLERLYGERAEDFAAELAYHFGLAGASESILAKAFHYSVAAGRRANALASYREALRHYSRALELAEMLGGAFDPAAHLEALEGSGLAQRELGLLSAAIETLRKVLELTPEPRQRARVRGEIASGLLHNDPSGALEEIAVALAELPTDDTPETSATAVRIRSFEAMCWFLAGRYTRVRQLGLEMEQSASRLDDPRLLFRAHSVISWADMGSGEVERAVETISKSFAAAQQSANKGDMASAHVNFAIEFYLSGRFVDAREHLDAAARLYGAAASDLWTANTRQLMGRVLLADGDLKRAQVEAEAALALAQDKYQRWAADCHDLLGAIHRLTGDYGTARGYLTTALTVRRRIGHSAGVVETLLELARVGVETDDWSTVSMLLGDALATARGMDPSLLLVAALRESALCHLQLEDVAEAERELTEAKQLADERFGTIEDAPTMLALAEFHTRIGQIEVATSLVERALQHPSTAEVAIRAHVAAATLHLLGGADDGLATAGQRASQAVELAQRLGAPRLETLALVGASRVAEAQAGLSSGVTTVGR